MSGLRLSIRGWARASALACLFAGAFLLCSAQAAKERILVRSLTALREHLGQDGVKVRLAPGTYRIEQPTTPNFFEFTGRNSHFDFTGVKFEVDTAVFAAFKNAGLNIVMLSGDGIVLEGLTIETIGNQPPRGGCRAINLMGRGVIVRNVSLRLSGSYPYGYGSYFGIGTESSIDPQKQNGIRIGGIDNQVINCRVVMRCFGHAIFLRGAQNALVKDCVVEGALRKTDDILAEKSGPAFDLGFRQYTGPLIPPGEMTSLSEDGIRAYPHDPETKRRTRDIRVENCRVTQMRRGICLAYAAGKNVITGCDVTESERVAYHVQSTTTIRDSRGDALYSQILDISTAGAKDSDIELSVLDSRAFYGHRVLATINGSGHRVVLQEAGARAVPAGLTIDVAQARSAPGKEPEPSRATRIALTNQTSARVVLHSNASACRVTSIGPVSDHGANNQTRVGEVRPPRAQPSFSRTESP